MAKPYQVRHVRAVITAYGLTMGEEAALYEYQYAKRNKSDLSQEPRFIYDYYLGLIHYYRHEFKKANQYFKKAKNNSTNPCIQEKSRELMKKIHLLTPIE